MMMKCLVRNSRGFLLGGLAISFLNACMPVPDSVLTSEQKEADMKWLYSIFDENYAPLEYKMSRYGFDYAALKSSFLKQALETSDNSSFYRVMHRFVAQFRDAHTTGSLSHGGLPNRARIAYLGISGRRQGDVFVVKELLPTYKSDESHFPIRVGDEISMIDGRPLVHLVKEEMIESEDIGHEEANLTYHMNRIFNRVSLDQALPEKSEAKITIVRREYTDDEKGEIEEREDRKIKTGEKKLVQLNVTVPWIVKDVYQFKKDQRLAFSASTNARSKSGSFISFALGSSLSDVFRLDGEAESFSIGLRGFDGSLKSPVKMALNTFRGVGNLSYLNSFYVPNQIEGWTADLSETSGGEEPSVTDQMKKVRYIPADAFFVTSPDATYPTYVTREKDRKSSSTHSGKLVATVYLNTFSPDAEEKDVVKEFNETLAKLQTLGVKDLIIDLLNNGGGSLSLGMKLAQALSPEKVLMPALQLRNSQTWRDEFLQVSLSGPSDAEKALGKKVYNQLQKENRQGKRISSPISAEMLIPFELTPNENLKKKFRIVLMVNEMCASMCDIFSGILQDNQMAKIVGSRTMGAGGNVVAHYFAPNSHFIVNQTESLVVRNVVTENGPVLGDYIENNGVQPDVSVPVTEAVSRKYRPVRQIAVNLLLKSRKRLMERSDQSDDRKKKRRKGTLDQEMAVE